MKKSMLIITFFCVCFCFSFTLKAQVENPFLLLPIEDIKGERDLSLSDLIEDLKMVVFENNENAIFKVHIPTISDKYILIRQSQGPYKLFDHSGKYVGEIGGYGQGSGEYESVYDEYIDEKEKKIYVAPAWDYSKIKVYNIDGTFDHDLEVGENLYKPKIYPQANGNLMIFHMALGGSKFLAREITREGEIVKDVPIRRSEHVPGGLENELFAYSNTDHFSYNQTGNDALMVYNPQTNAPQPIYRIDFHTPSPPFVIHNEIPGYYITSLYGEIFKTIAIDKKTKEGFYVRKFKNDFLGDMDGSGLFNKGWYSRMFKPAELVEKIDERLAESDCSAADRKKLEALKKNIDLNGNNIMLYGKLKK